MVAYLTKFEGSEGFYEITDFLSGSHISYALTENLTIYVSLIEQFWQTAALSTSEDGIQAITATIDGREKTITKASLRRHLKLEDSEGIPLLPNEEIFEHLTRIGYGEAPSTSPSRISSSPSLPSHHTSSSTPTTPPSTQQPYEAEEPVTMPHDSPLHRVHSYGSDEGRLQQIYLMDLVTKLTDKIGVLEKDLQQTKKTYNTALTKLVLRVKKLEKQVKSGKARKRARIDEGISWFQQDEEVHEKTSADTEVLVQEETPTKIFKDIGSGEKGEKEISTANVPVSTAGPEVSTASTDVSTAAAALVYIRRSASKAKEKGKGIMTEPEPPKKLKKRVQVQLTIDEDLAKKLFEEERARFNAEQEARAKEEQEQEMSDFEVAQELQRQLDERQEVPAKPTQAHKIDWNDPGYKQRYFKGMTYEDIRPIFEKVWDQVNTFVPMGSELEKESSKESSKPVEEDVEPQQVMKESSTKSKGRRRKSLPRKRARKAQDEEKTKKQKHEDDAEKEELRLSLKIVSDEDKDIDYEVLDMKMLETFDRDDVLNLHRLVMEKFPNNDPVGYDLLLWGDLKVLVDPKEDDNIWKNQQEWKMISWKLFETCGVHSLMVDGTLLTIHIFVEKKLKNNESVFGRILSKSRIEDLVQEETWDLKYNVSTAIVNFVLPEEVNTAEDVEDKDV
ncbi:hypothetical protein Tco_1438479 [Tanacetum coccineum]